MTFTAAQLEVPIVTDTVTWAWPVPDPETPGAVQCRSATPSQLGPDFILGDGVDVADGDVYRCFPGNGPKELPNPIE